MLFDVHEVYDPSDDAWSIAPAMPIPRHGVAAVALDNGFLTPAGGTVQGLAPTAAVDVFIPAVAVPTVSMSGRVSMLLLLLVAAGIVADRSVKAERARLRLRHTLPLEGDG